MNFTFEGLSAATNAVDRLRTFHRRMWIVSDLGKSGFDDSETKLEPSLPSAIERARQDFTSALTNDLNTAEAIAAIFELVRAGNAAADAGSLRPTVAYEILQVLALFDGVFAVIVDKDEERTDAAVAWAKEEGRWDGASPEMVERLDKAEIEALLAERTQAKKTRNFARADAIRKDLLEKGIVIEDGKDGVRWKRK
jgi:cysteinyl-tRNA synthetase